MKRATLITLLLALTIIMIASQIPAILGINLDETMLITNTTNTSINITYPWVVQEINIRDDSIQFRFLTESHPDSCWNQNITDTTFEPDMRYAGTDWYDNCTYLELNQEDEAGNNMFALVGAGLLMFFTAFVNKRRIWRMVGSIGLILVAMGTVLVADNIIMYILFAVMLMFGGIKLFQEVTDITSTRESQ